MKIFAALVAAFIVAILPGAAPASAARMGGPEIKALIITSRVSDLPAVSTGLGDAASLNCWNGQNEFNRTQACWNVILTFTFIQNGTPIGVTGANLVEYMTLNADGTKWTQHDTMTDVGSSGTTEPVDFQLYYTDCKKPCKAVPHFAGVVKDGASGTVDYSDPLAADQIEQTHTHYLLEASALNYLPLNWSDWNSDEFRCDDDLTPQTVPAVPAPATLQPPGCIYPGYTPTLTLPISTYGASAAMIQWAQQHLNGKWGLQSSNKPLNRLGNATLATENRKKVCQTDWVPRPAVIQDSCDEYPFAGSTQSPGLLTSFTSGKACAQVTAVETGKAGQTLVQRWKTVQPLGTYSPSALCVRGHIPYPENRSAGLAYARLVNSARLLPNDPFWVAVTP